MHEQERRPARRAPRSGGRLRSPRSSPLTRDDTSPAGLGRTLSPASRQDRSNGEGGIRTRERACAPYSLSRRVPSATRPPLRGRPILDTRSGFADTGPAAARIRSPAAVTRADPTVDRERLKARYDAIFATATPPFAFVDLDAMGANARGMLDQAGGLPIRIASKSVRSAQLLRRILELDPGFRGVLAYTLPRRSDSPGRDSRTSSSPTRRSTAARSPSRAARGRGPRAAPVLMVDDRAASRPDRGRDRWWPGQVRVCLDLDVGWWPLGGRLARIGPKRSPVHDPARAARMAEEIDRAAGNPARRAARLRGTDRRGRRPDRRQAAPQRRDQDDAVGIRA